MLFSIDLKTMSSIHVYTKTIKTNRDFIYFTDLETGSRSSVM